MPPKKRDQTMRDAKMLYGSMPEVSYDFLFVNRANGYVWVMCLILLESRIGTKCRVITFADESAIPREKIKTCQIYP